MPTQSKPNTGAPIDPDAAPVRPDGEDTAPVQASSDQHRGEPAHPGVPLAPEGIAPESDVRLHSPSAAAPQPSHGVVEELGDLPHTYGDGRLVALVRDPSTLYVYWDFSPHQLEQAFHGLGNARAVLRPWNVRAGEAVRDYEVHLDARGWYLRDLPPGSELRVELWAVGDKGARMMRAARPVKLPPAVPSDVLEAFYVRLPLDQPLPRDGVSTARPLQYGGSAPSGWERRAQARASSLGGAPGSLPSSLAGRLPWSGTHLMPDLGDDK